MDNISKNRIIWMDVARFIALISISLNHAFFRAFDLNKRLAEVVLKDVDFSLFISIILYFFSRLGVSLFLMITGALILSKKFETTEDIKYYYKNNLLRILITSEIWMAIMYLIIVISKIPGYDIPEARGLLIGNFFKTMLFDMKYTYGNMWYIPMILSVYTILPLIAVGLNKLGKKIILVPLAVVIVSGMLIPNILEIMYMLGYEMDFFSSIMSENVFSIYVPYVLVGYFISKGMLKSIPSTPIAILAFANFLMSCFYIIWYAKTEYYYDISYYHILTLLTSTFVFELIRRYGDRLRYLRKPVVYISRISFSVFFIHIIIMEFMRYYIDFGEMSEYLILAIFEVASIAISVLIVAVFSQNKFLRKYMFMIK